MPVALLDQAAATNESTSGTLDFDADVVNQYIASPEGTGTLRGEYPHNKSASSAYWDPRGRQIVSTSYDDTLRRTFGPFFPLYLTDVVCSMGHCFSDFPY